MDTTTTVAAQTDPCHFLTKTIPEIRNIIYQMVCCDLEINLRLKHNHNPTRKPRNNTPDRIKAKHKNPLRVISSDYDTTHTLFSLSRTCSDIHNECTQMIYSMNKFRLAIGQDVQRGWAEIQAIEHFREQIGGANSAALTELHVVKLSGHCLDEHIDLLYRKPWVVKSLAYGIQMERTSFEITLDSSVLKATLVASLEKMEQMKTNARKNLERLEKFQNMLEKQLRVMGREAEREEGVMEET